MIRLNIAILAAAIMCCLIPIAPSLAVSGDSPLYTHFVYMFGHANILHWLINSWALLIYHNLLRPGRLAVAYTMAVLITFLPPVGSGEMPLIGASVITCFLFGFCLQYLFYKDRLSALMMVALILIGFFLPGIAALPHLLMFLCGAAWYVIERLYYSFIRFVSR